MHDVCMVSTQEILGIDIIIHLELWVSTGVSFHPETLANVWRQFWLSQLGVTTEYLMGKDQGFCWISYNAQDSLSTKKKYLDQNVKTVLRLRDPDIKGHIKYVQYMAEMFFKPLAKFYFVRKGIFIWIYIQMLEIEDYI